MRHCAYLGVLGQLCEIQRETSEIRMFSSGQYTGAGILLATTHRRKQCQLIAGFDRRRQPAFVDRFTIF